MQKIGLKLYLDLFLFLKDVALILNIQFAKLKNLSEEFC